MPTQKPEVPESGLGELLRLAWPLIVGHAGNQLMGFVDTAMVGRLGEAALAGMGIGNGIYAVVGLFESESIPGNVTS